MGKVLIACEYSGIVRDAFAALGHYAVSCDLLPSESPGNHYQGYVLDIINDGWDLMIAHPPCTFLSYASMAVWSVPGRTMKRIKAAEFFMQLFEADIDKICVENPRGIMSQLFRKPDMEIHPYYFGDKQMKRTNLWLKNLPALQYQLQPDLFSQKVTATEKPKPIQIQVRRKTGQIKKRYTCDNTLGVHFKNGHERSRFFPGIAKAMAEQWGKLI